MDTCESYKNSIVNSHIQYKDMIERIIFTISLIKRTIHFNNYHQHYLYYIHKVNIDDTFVHVWSKKLAAIHLNAFQNVTLVPYELLILFKH
jgi:hypothetical protein